MTLQELAKKASIPESEVARVASIIEEENLNAPVERTPETQEVITAFWKKLVEAKVFSSQEESGGIHG